MERVAADRIATSFGDDVRSGLSADPKSLLPKYFYDELGSHLFEAITWLPEYYVTRAEREILSTCADEIASSIPPPWRLIELGSGSSDKTRLLIEAAFRQQGSLEYLPIDISATALERSSRSLLQAYPALRVRAFEADYEGALGRLSSERQEPASGETRSVVAFLGSSIGNLAPDAAVDLLTRVRRVLGSGDAMLLGADLRKEQDVLIPAYDDALGVTAAFNLNLLVRINRELGGEFDPRHFRHHVFFNDEESRVELHAVSRMEQTVRIRALDLEVAFEEGESIHTENSYKFSIEMLEKVSAAADFRLSRVWRDGKRRFSLSLLLPI